MNKIIAVAAALVVLVGIPGYTQDSEELKSLKTRQDTPEFERDISVILQLVDVTAVDAEGKYITDLSKDEFTIYVNGEVVDIRTFDSFFPGIRIPAGEEQALDEVPEDAAPGRRLILFFDQAYSSYHSLRKAKEASREFITRNLSPGDLVMIIGYDHAFKIYNGFTRDREAMLESIDKISFSRMGANRGTTFSSENSFNVRGYLQAMTNLGRYLKMYRGRKTLVMLSEGYDQRIALASLLHYQSEALETFNDSNTSVYSLDISGLESGASNPLSGANRKRNRQDTLGIFADDTGGKFYRGNNNLEKLLLDMDVDISNYYVLGFQAPTAPDGEFREIRVTTSRPGVRLNFRKGFYAPEPYEKLSSDERAFHLEEGLARATPIKEMNTGFATSVFPRNDGTAVAGLAVSLELETTGPQEIELLGYVYNGSEDVIDIFHKKFTFNNSTAGRHFRYFQPAQLDAGENLIKAVVRDNNTGKRAYNFSVGRMPMLGEGMHASTITFEDPSTDAVDGDSVKIQSFRKDYDIDASEPAQPLSPIIREGKHVLAGYTVPRSSNVGLMIKLSGISDGDAGPMLAPRYSLRNEDGERIPLVERELRLFPVSGTGEVIVYSVIDFRKVSKGDYILTAEISDEAAGTVIGRRSVITVE